jgi:hypothetical protein
MWPLYLACKAKQSPCRPAVVLAVGQVLQLHYIICAFESSAGDHVCIKNGFCNGQTHTHILLMCDFIQQHQNVPSNCKNETYPNAMQERNSLSDGCRCVVRSTAAS